MLLSAHTCTIGFLSLLATTFFIGGIAMQFIAPKMVKSQAKEMVPMKDNTSALYQPWVDHGGFGSPQYNEYYLFNVTNAEAVVAGTETPRVKTIGPFVYRMYIWKENVEWSKDRTEISFTYHNYNVFLPERTPKHLDLNAEIVVPNFALQGVAWTLYTSGMLDMLGPIIKAKKIDAEHLFMRRPIREVLWGYTDPLLEALSGKIPNSPSPFIGLQSIDTPFFYSAPSKQYSGVGDYRKVSQYSEWCGMKDLTQYWKDDPTPITGTDGWQFSPDPADNEPILIDALNVVGNLVKGEDSKYNGVDCKRYRLDPEMLKNTSHFGKTHYNLGISGQFNLTSVRGASVFASKPYFLDADPMFLQMVQMDRMPTKEADDTFIDVEPITGAAVQAFQRLQVNLQMEPWMCAVAQQKDCKIKNSFIPMMYVVEITQAPSAVTDALKAQIYGIPKTVQTVAWVAFGLSFGILLWVVALVLQYRKDKKAKKLDEEEEPFINETEQNHHH